MEERTLLGLGHVLRSQQFERDWLEGPFFEQTTRMRAIVNQGGCRALSCKRMIALFYEPSTRTRFSFQLAMSYLGGEVFHTENAGEFSSAVKGESISDTIRVLCEYAPDVIVLRHHEDGAAEMAANVSGGVPIINAGDGRGQHPTQALLDIYTIHSELGRIDGLSIAMVGDLANGRTVRSLSYLLGKFGGIKIYLVSPRSLQMRQDIKEYLARHSAEFAEATDLREVAPEVDVIYQTRTQKERGSVLDRNDHTQGYFTVDAQILSLMKSRSIIMHPLPRVDEIAPEVDDDPRAAYFRQAGNGLYTRMALLQMLLAPII